MPAEGGNDLLHLGDTCLLFRTFLARWFEQNHFSSVEKQIEKTFPYKMEGKFNVNDSTQIVFPCPLHPLPHGYIENSLSYNIILSDRFLQIGPEFELGISIYQPFTECRVI